MSVRVVCVNIKQTAPPRKIKSKVLRSLRKAEKKTAVNNSLSISQPLQTWNKESHTIVDLESSEVAKVLSNTRYMVFLMKDGRIGRLKCNSPVGLGNKDRSVLDALQRTGPTFQELSDAEFARQLHSEMNSRRVDPSLETQAVDDIDQVIYMGTLYDRLPDYYTNMSTPGSAQLPGALSSSPMSSRPMASLPQIRSALSSSSKKEKVSWPEIGALKWANEDSGPRFSAMAVLHSEVLLVDSVKRRLYSWRCEGEAEVTPHPLSSSLGLEGERIALIESGEVRVTIVTESGKVATFYDALLRDIPGKGCPPLISSLSHNLKTFPELANDKITTLSVSQFITTVTTASGRVLWWGLCPQAPNTSSRPFGGSSRGTIADGSLVKLKDGPPCGPNAVVYSQTQTGIPLIGKTVVEHSSLNSRSSVLVRVYKNSPSEGQTSNQPNSPLLRDIESSMHFDNLDIWKLTDVVFLDDSPAILGRVVTVDQHQAIVDVSGDATSSKSTLKVFKTSDLELCINTIPPVASGSSESTSQHVAGIVQHSPLVISTPEISDEDSSKNVIHGFKPLAVHTTYSGPSLLLERTTDKHTFLVCSGHSSHGPFSTSSYVALGLGSKPVRCTAFEESVHSVEAGLSSLEGQTPSFVSCHNSHLLFLKDVNGQLLALNDGLKLSLEPPSDGTTRLSATYSCVHLRSYSLEKDRVAVVIVLVPSMKQLLKRVLSGDLPTVQKWLSSLQLSSQLPRKRSFDDPPPEAKRVRLESGVSEDMPGPSSRKNRLPCDIGELYLCSENNSNVLHICCELSTSKKNEHVVVSSPDQPSCGIERRLAILDALLSCELIRPHIIKLLCLKNAFGHTPFYSAIVKQNLSAAIKIFDFVSSLNDRQLLEKAVLTQSSNGITPLTQVFASVSPTFDLCTSRLLVSNIPSGYRAQVLLKVFQQRYPSVYKVCIVREDEDAVSMDGSDSSGDDEEDLSPLTRRIPRRHYTPSMIPSAGGLSGVVFFSDIAQLRAALVELQEFRLTMTSSRNTGFGQAQQNNSLVVQLYGSGESSNSISGLGSHKKKKTIPSGADLYNGTNCSQPQLALSLVTKLLSLPGVSCAVGAAGETTLQSILHNSKCLKALSDIKKGRAKPTETQSSQHWPGSSNETGSRSMPSRAEASDSLQPTQSLMPPILPYTSLADYLTELPNRLDLAHVIRNYDMATSSETQDYSEPASTSSAQTTQLPKPPSSVCSCKSGSGDSDNEIDLLLPLVSDWPCLVTSVFGCYPLDSSTRCSLSSAHSLDSFISRLLLNSDSVLLDRILDNIVSKMNEIVSLNGENIRLLTEDVDWTNVDCSKLSESDIPLLVGRRFVESAVRVLAMNHSRVGSTLTQRQGEVGRDQNDSSSRTGSQSSNSEPTSKEILEKIMSVLSRFSWLAIHSLVVAADASIAPVRLGVAKPLGASSVASEYQSVHSYGSMPSYRRSTTPTSAPHSLTRVIHTRTALKRPAKTSLSHSNTPPRNGILLTPMRTLGAESADSDMETSDIDEPTRTSRAENTTGDSQTYPWPVSDNFVNQIHSFTIDFDNDASDDEDFPPLPGEAFHFEADLSGQGEAESEEERMEDIYPYAWALDGRRIGETSSGGGHQAMMANITMSSAEAVIPLASIPSIRFGSGFLARSFARLVKDMVDLVKLYSEPQPSQTTLSLPDSVKELLIERCVGTLDKTWGWVVSALDVAEGQLQRGEQFDTERHVMSLRTGARQVTNRRPGRTSRSFVGSTPSEYIAYLIRSRTQEDQLSLPVLDLYGYEHVVYCLDGLLYLLSHLPKNCLSNTPPQQLAGEQSEDTQSKNEAFFTRTASVSFNTDQEVLRSNNQFFGQEGSEFSRSAESYTLAKKLHLLKPFVETSPKTGGEASKQKLPVSYSRNQASMSESITRSWNTEQVHARWSTAISVFAHIFLAEGPGGERSNFLNSKAGFASRMARFRHQVSQLLSEAQMSRDWSRTMSNTFAVRVRREQLLQDSLDMLLSMSRFHYSSIRVKFEGEDGSGPGVNRGFFAALANELMNSDPSKAPANKMGRLLHQPGKLPEQLGAFSPCPFVSPLSTPPSKSHTIKASRKSAFLSIGRFLGLCLWFKYTIPLTLCRHVAKFLLGRDIAWHDLAFYNADLYEGMRRMMVDIELDKKDSEEFMATYCCYFEAPLSGPFPEPVLVDLIPGGSKVPVTPSRVHEYVRLYAMFTMVGCVKDELEALKEGLNDIVPAELLSSLTAEDFQLLLSGGSIDISVARLKTVIRFNHTHRGSQPFSQNFERMFWRVVRNMSNTQRQQLLYFATGSASLPANSDIGVETPIAITIDVISSSDVNSLPVSSTCSQRMSLPLYPSYSILKKKLLQAIQCQAYGLG